jgi:hypothetical protein
MTGDIELGKTNVVAPQETENGAVIDINDEENEIYESDKIDKAETAEESQESIKAADSNIQDDMNNDDDEENTPLGYCRFIAEHHHFAFGMFIFF